jgi:hypothetical protein
MIERELVEPRAIVNMEPDDGGSIITLACGHVIWSTLEPVYSAGKMYCAICVNEFVEQLRANQRPA